MKRYYYSFLIYLLIIPMIFSQTIIENKPPSVTANPSYQYWTNSPISVELVCSDDDVCTYLYYLKLDTSETCPLDTSLYNLKANPSCVFYREIIVNNSGNPNNLTDYQIKITIDTGSLISAGKMRPDCGDLRAYYYNETSGNLDPIPYWIEEDTCNTSQTNVWVKVPLIKNNTITYLYLEYGNKSLTSESNGSAVFDWFSDCSSLSQWPTTACAYVVDNDYIKINDTSSTAYCYIRSSFSFPNNESWINVEKFRVNSFQANGNSLVKLFEHSDNVNWTYGWIDENGYLTWDNGTNPISIYIGNIVGNGWHIFKVVKKPSYKYDVYFDNNKVLTDVLPRGDGTTANNIYIQTTVNSYADIDIDWVFVRKYSDIEPNVSLSTEFVLGCSLSSFSFSINITEEGETKICAIGEDNQGATTSKEFYPYQIDYTPPTTSATPSTYTSSNPFNVTLNCSDNLSGCNTTYYIIVNQTTCPDTGYSYYSGSITISNPGRWYICAYSTDNAGNIENKKLFGTYYLLDETTLIYIGNLAKIVSNKNYTNFVVIFFREFNTDFGFLFNYNGTYSIVYLNNSKLLVGSCDIQGYCDIYFYKPFYYKSPAIEKISCSDNVLKIYEDGQLVSYYSWPCNGGKIGFVCKNCYLGLIGIIS